MAKYDPIFNSPKEINLEDFIPPHNVVESYKSGLVIQENKIFPKFPIYINYRFYNWVWSVNEGIGITTSDKWLWKNQDGTPILESSSINYPVVSYNNKLAALYRSGLEVTDSTDNVPVEKYSPLRLWNGSRISETIAGKSGAEVLSVSTDIRDSSLYLDAKAHDVSFYMKKGRPLLGNVSSNRNANQIEYYIKDGIIVTNFDFDNDPVMRESVVISYETITKNVKVKTILRSNEHQSTFYTPTVNNYILRVAGQTSSKERLT